jgi:PAS domain S-box-containing protein
VAVLKAQVAGLNELLVVQENVVSEQSARIEKVRRELSQRIDERAEGERKLKEYAAELERVNEGLHREIASRRRAQEALGRAEEAAQRESARLLAMISGMEEGVAFADSTNVIVEVNDYGCRFFRTRRDEIVGKRIEDIHAGEALARIEAQIEIFRRDTGAEPLVLQRRLRGAEVILRVQPIYRGADYDGVLLNIVDVTELVMARRQAEEANAAKSVFLANMSHEIRTPMTAILGYTDLMMDPSVSPSDRNSYLAVIHRNGEHLLALINDILDVSKIEAGRMTLDLRPCPLVPLLSDLASIMRVKSQQRGVDLKIEYAGELPETITTDEVRLRQMLLNLVGNAIKFTDEGSIRVAVAFIPDGIDGGPNVMFQIIDTGCGISHERLESIFEPFVQADSALTGKHGGSGLGLTISRRIARMFGGDLTVESVPGEGSVFTLVLPTGPLEGVKILREPAESVRPETARIDGPAGEPLLKGLRILVAEDGLDNQKLVCTVLRKAGAEVELAENGQVAVEMASRSPEGHYDAILMDMQMPVMDGYEATRVLRQSGWTRPILALTAHALSGDREECIKAGCNDHLAKPIDRYKLIQTIADCAGVPPSGAKTPLAERAPGGAPSESVRSEFADDPDLADILDEFVLGLSSKVELMHKAISTAYVEELQRLAHQLKGAGGSYGYPSLTAEAKALEEAARGGDLEAARRAMERLDALCGAIARGRGVRSVPGDRDA